MEKIKLVEKRVRFSSTEQIVRLQFILYCFAKEIHLTPGDYSLLTHVAINGYDRKQTPFDLVKKSTFQHLQSVRNTRNNLVKQGLLLKSKSGYIINPELCVESGSPLILDFKAILL